MRILDRERYWAFLKAYCICFIALVGLYVVIDAFSNLDEFSEVSTGSIELFRNMGHYYLVRMSLFYDRLCGVISMMAAIFAVTWMQRNNELLAMLAAGIGTKRIIRPIWISAALVSLIAVANQEFILPQVSEELLKTPDDDGTIKKAVYSREDSNGVTVSGKEADRATRTVTQFNATFSTSLNGSLYWVDAKTAKYIPPDDPRCPRKGGWLLRGAKVMPDIAEADDRVLVRLVAMEQFPPLRVKLAEGEDATYFLREDQAGERLTLNRKEPNFNVEIPIANNGTTGSVTASQAEFIPADNHDAPISGGWLLRGARLKPEAIDTMAQGLIRLESQVGYPKPEGLADLGGETYFLTTGLSFTTVTRKPGEWYQYATTRDLILALNDPASEPEKSDISVFLHARLIRPFTSLCLMFLSLPLVLGGTGRNMFINLGMSLGTSGVFYAVSFLSQYLGSNAVYSPEIAAWVPLIIFGTIAVARWDTIRT